MQNTLTSQSNAAASKHTYLNLSQQNQQFMLSSLLQLQPAWSFIIQSDMPQVVEYNISCYMSDCRMHYIHFTLHLLQVITLTRLFRSFTATNVIYLLRECTDELVNLHLNQIYCMASGITYIHTCSWSQMQDTLLRGTFVAW